MYFRRGPIGLIIISILVLGFFMELAEGSDMDSMVVILIAVFGCPLLSMIIYYCIEAEKIKKQQEKLQNDALRSFNYNDLWGTYELDDDELDDDELDDDDLDGDDLDDDDLDDDDLDDDDLDDELDDDESDIFDINDPLYEYKKRNNTLNDSDEDATK